MLDKGLIYQYVIEIVVQFLNSISLFKKLLDVMIYKKNISKFFIYVNYRII